MYRIGVDVGGTFTDFTVTNATTGENRYFKLSSTPADPSVAIVEGIKQVLDTFDIAPSDVSYIGHGTTVATNMIIERRGVPTALITTKGFRDVLAIGRQTRPALYDVSITKPAPLVDRFRRLEVNERLNARGEILKGLDETELETVLDELAETGIKALSVCFLHSYRNAAHEEATARIIAEKLPGVYVSLSSKVLPEFREYERTSTTVLNAYVGPKMADYFDRLEEKLRELGIPVAPMTIHSNGGLLSIDTAKRLPVTTCLSGPAAGVIGSAVVGAAAGIDKIVTYDVGGTSTDVSLIVDGRPKFTSSRDVAGYPVKLPMVDIHVIGAGGGSIAQVDDAGALKVGPRSAGALPGPIAYQRGGEEPTLTDANICLNRLNPVALLDGRMPVDRAAALAAIEEKIARPLAISGEEAAYGILQVAIANMSRAIRAVTTEQGHEIAEITLFAFGGAGPLHAAEVAREAGIRRILVPQEPGTMCARGALLLDISLDFVRMQLAEATTEGWEQACNAMGEMLKEGNEWLDNEKVDPALREFHLAIDAHYAGQTHDIRVPLNGVESDGLSKFLADFADLHRSGYGYDIPDQAVVIVGCRLQAVGRVPKAITPTYTGGESVISAKTAEREIYYGPQEGWRLTPIYRRALLPVGEGVAGPAIIDEMSSTTVVLAGQIAMIDAFGNIIITN
ncbi:hydantoinase/oxoprolinase family protein [Rhizobium pusense]|uniref:hydantoinase/oxoprolinase family protein n=1 Tax=Agrobacterium pusense TaxID=648995 RepID=UPI000DD68B3F|nr:hydantoinase/oxoprolinase family protein [Agrobacterium pusense]MBW9081150.1 hydantoinase/oxoprolinase family protein [Agrobacterium pusense]